MFRASVKTLSLASSSSFSRAILVCYRNYCKKIQKKLRISEAVSVLNVGANVKVQVKRLHLFFVPYKRRGSLLSRPLFIPHWGINPNLHHVFCITPTSFALQFMYSMLLLLKHVSFGVFPPPVCARCRVINLNCEI